MTVESLQLELYHLEEVSQSTLGYTHLSLKAACAAAEVGDISECCHIIDRAIPMFSRADLDELSTPLIGLYNQLAPAAA